MNKSQVVEVMHSGRSFAIRTADGREYRVPTQDHLAISPRGTYVTLIGDDDLHTTIPLLTMTAIEYSPLGIASN